MTFISVFSYFHMLVEKKQKNTFFISTIFFFSKIAQITFFYAFIFILRQYINFFLKLHKWLEKRMYFFVFLPRTNENKKKKHWNSNFLGRFFYFIQIPYIILVKEGFFKMPLILLKNGEKHVIYYFFRKKV